MRIGQFISAFGILVAMAAGCGAPDRKDSGGEGHAVQEEMPAGFTGTWMSYYPGGNVESVKEMKNGEVSGSVTEYYDNGKVREKYTRIDGKLQGQYHPNAFTTYSFKLMEDRAATPGIYNYENHTNVQWWLGEGLSYTSFSYSNLAADKESFGPGETIKFTVDVTNTGDRAGKETVFLFSSDEYASLMPDNT